MILPSANLPMGLPGPWKPAWKVTAPLVIARDQQGKLHHAYRGSMLGWLSEDQSQHFLRHGLVERVEAEQAPELPPADVIGNCVAALAELGVPLRAGRPTAAKALRDAGHRFGNEALAEACKIRQASAPLDEDRDFAVV